MLNKILLISLIFIAHIPAQTFTASVNNVSVGVNEPFQVAFEFKGDDINSLKSFKAPDFSGFRILSGPNQSTSMQIINGSVSASLSFTYYLQASSVGTFTIGAASVDHKGKTYKTAPIKMSIIKGSAAQNQKQQTDQSAAAKNISENVFIRAIADRQKVYKGEQVTVTYKLYTRMDISNPQISKLPAYQGFWAEEIETAQRISFATEVLNGRQFHTAVLKKAALFPTQTGQLTVSPFELVIPVVVPKQRKRGDIFDEFFNDPFFNRSTTVEHKAVSNTIKVDVLPLPEDNKPSTFTGAVGNFKLNAEVDKKSAKINEPITLRYTISGSGNINLIDMPEIKIPAGFEKYDPKINQQINRTGVISGQKIFEYLIVPRAQGKKEIPPVEFSYFNSSSKKYVILYSPDFTLNIEKGIGGYESASGYGKEDVKLLGEDIRFIKTSSSSFSKRGDYVYNKFWFWVMGFIPLFAFTGMVLKIKKEERLSGNVQLLRYQKAEKAAKNRLKAAKASLEAKNQEVFYSDISLALYGYLEDKLRIPKSDFTVEKAVATLTMKNISPVLVERVKDALQKCEYARFAPQPDINIAMQGMYSEASGIIIELERELLFKKKSGNSNTSGRITLEKRETV